MLFVRSASEQDLSRMVLTNSDRSSSSSLSTTTASSMIMMVQHPASPLPMMAHHQRTSSGVRRFCRWAAMLAIFCFLVFFYLTAFYCWPNTMAIFSGHPSHHQFRINPKLSQILQEHGPLKRKPCPTFGCGPRLRNSLPSLMVRPLKNASQAISLQSLTVERLEKWFRFINASDDQSFRNHLLNCTEQTVWHAHRESYRQRSDRLHRVCRRYGYNERIFNSWHFSANRRPIYRHRTGTATNQSTSSAPKTRPKFCNTRNCPLVVSNEHRLLTCFVQKIASTSIKHLYLYLQKHSDGQQSPEMTTIEPLRQENLTTFHQRMNDQLYRISPTFLPYVQEGQYYKTIFVRHPFVRLVSAFKDKAERQPSEESYFYAVYWNPLLDRLYGKDRHPNQRVTFREFVEELLLPTDPYQYDEHWAPIWTRCEPCLVHYDFIGKLETGEQDFRNFRSRLAPALMNVTVWENLNQEFGHSAGSGSGDNLSDCQRQRLKYGETIRYLSQLAPRTIIELYKRYYLDFELFGYTMDELFEMVK